ncbi:4-diphosphocytidyl-2-C-methyl-D-erythritol kinase [Larkinella arboricola]|uniref:4-diphosphocytidyl-2-C-methyl-D-erythritol kinase n=1 Tax=Larkinella arboricola TaxID=643671 RepID=A0A327X4M8_LARAB|nr:4-(cytidine 5'-diphospho)-2-C-methyl-D-erythritol kinase [Larkinella arboricola]RAK02060.1 4-diphosphocytidyl-2-C-methyl-D-erythritol kinase [Larkinella arboricola]
MVFFPNAKINIGLQITAKRPDGFHNLESCFYPVPLNDLLEIIPASYTSFTLGGMAIPGDISTNLCVRAYERLKQDFGLPPVRIHLHKLIPIGAGLGGGSADAAFTLRLLNEQFMLGLSVEQLENYARELGSDCAFFIQNRPMYCFEKGDQFAEIEVSLNGYTLVLIYPNLAISTAEAYAGVRPHQPAASLRALLQAPLETWKGTILNDFEKSLFSKYPILGSLKQELYDLGALYASMSGSGSTIYGIFAQPVELPAHFDTYQVWQKTL